MKPFFRIIFLIYCSSSNIKAGSLYSKPEEKNSKPDFWEQAWHHSSFLRSPLKDEPIENLEKVRIRKLLKKTKIGTPIKGRWVSNPIFILQNKSLILPKRGSDLFVFAPFVHFSTDFENQPNKETAEMRYLPLYKTGEVYPCAIIIESEQLPSIKEEIPEDDFSQDRNVSNFGRYRAKTVDSFQKVFLHMNLLPSILNAVGLRLPDDAKFSISCAEKSIRVNRFYHDPEVDSKDLETDSIHHDCKYNSLLEKGKLGISIIQMHPGPEFNGGNGRGFFLAGVSKKPLSEKSEVFLIPADKRYVVIMLMDHCLHGTERWSKYAPRDIYRTSYNFRLMINAEKDPIELWQEIIKKSWN